ncbi:MAG TPA: inositol monophosphatase family protein [Blastocatellia bacterium]|jgi:myo-inositol-1(or 4)-monophosphatase|nr:inositol monophosphatase family protein [Blastocatellia bacterium]
MLNFAIRVARDAGQLLRDRVGTRIDIGHKGAINIVTDVDLASERLIRDAIATHYPRHQVLAEEGGLAENSSEYRWIVDPLDGTTNFAHGYPVFCVSIALEYRGETVLGVVYDPTRDELFSAERGGGAALNNRPIRVSGTGDLMQSLLSTGFPYDIKTSTLTNLDHWANFAMNAQALRRDGAAALDLCYVACGRFDGFWELNLSAWDTAAGSLIVTEAGGRVTDFAGGKFSNYAPQVLASNGLIHDRMIEVLALPKK